MNYDLIKNKKIAIAIMARDCEQALTRNIPYVEQLCSYFGAAKILIIENDSIDNTKNILNDWSKKNKNVSLLIKDNMKFSSETTGTGIGRIGRMVYYRNLYIDYFRENDIGYDYLIVIDIDVDFFSVEGIISSIIDAPRNWTGLFANGRYYTKIFNKILISKYYDNYAFVPKDSNVLDLNYKEIKLNNDLVNKNVKKKKYFPCISAFGGVGLYDFKYVKNNYYEVLNNTRSDFYKVVCEHIPFNNRLISDKEFNGNYIAKNMLVLYKKISIIEYIRALFIRQNMVLLLYRILKKPLL